MLPATDPPIGATQAGQVQMAGTLVRLSHLVHYLMADVGRGFDLTAQQTQLMCQLRCGPVGMAELGRSLHLEKSSLTGLVDRVERRGLVIRIPDTRDRRALMVGLTELGLVLGAQANHAVSSRLDALSADLDPEEAAGLSAAIEAMIARHSAATGCEKRSDRGSGTLPAD